MPRSVGERDPVEVHVVGRLAAGERDVDGVRTGDPADVRRHQPPALPAAGVGDGEAAAGGRLGLDGAVGVAGAAATGRAARRCRRRRPGTAGTVDLELPQRAPVRRGALGAVEPDVPTGGPDGQVLDAARAERVERSAPPPPRRQPSIPRPPGRPRVSSAAGLFWHLPVSIPPVPLASGRIRTGEVLRGQLAGAVARGGVNGRDQRESALSEILLDAF